MTVHYLEHMDIFRMIHPRVIPVNCVGSCGTGIARQFALQEPRLALAFAGYVKEHGFHPGDCLYLPWDVGYVFMATKNAPWNPSTMSWVRQGLETLRERAPVWRLSNVALPRVGCGCGGLDWKNVKPVVEEVLGPSDVTVWVCLYP